MYFNPPSITRGAPIRSMFTAAVAADTGPGALHPPVSAGVAVGSGGAGVFVAVTIIGVAVGGTGVAVAVGGTGVAVGGTGVAVAVAGTGVSVGGTGVSVGGTGVSVSAADVGTGVGTPMNTRFTTLNVPGS